MARLLVEADADHAGFLAALNDADAHKVAGVQFRSADMRLKRPGDVAGLGLRIAGGRQYRLDLLRTANRQNIVGIFRRLRRHDLRFGDAHVLVYHASG